MVSAPSLTINNITDALLAGQFYSSNGPTITDYGVKDGQVYVTCSPVQSIHFVAFERRGGAITLLMVVPLLPPVTPYMVMRNMFRWK